MAVSANKLELLQIADLLADEKGIDKEIVIEAMEEAIQKAARGRYGAENDIVAQIDRATGESSLFRQRAVVEEVENDHHELLLADAKRLDAEIELGDFLREPLPPIEFGRIAAQTAKQVIVQKVRDAERERQYGEFKDRVDEIISGVVKRVEYGNVIIDLGRAEGIMRRDQILPRETFRVGDRVRCYIYDVRREQRGPQIFLSRTHENFMVHLFAQEVPEIYDGVIEIRAVARDPGSRAKIAVFSNDSSIDPVGACVGMRGSRVQAVVNELQGEKIDIIPHTEDIASFIVSALQPATVVKVVMDEDAGKIEVVVPDDQLSLAIGRRGQNVRLASQLSGWDIDILTEEEESARRQEEFAQRTALFTAALDVDELVAQLLASEGFTSMEEIAYVEIEELTDIEGFDDDTADELQARARDYLARQEEILVNQAKELGAQEDLLGFEGLTPKMLAALAEAEILSLEDFAGSVADELIGGVDFIKGEKIKIKGILEGFDLTELDANRLIMTARLVVGWIDEMPDLEPEVAEEGEDEDIIAEAEGEELAAAVFDGPATGQPEDAR